jgi:hypothetical protein
MGAMVPWWLHHNSHTMFRRFCHLALSSKTLVQSSFSKISLAIIDGYRVRHHSEAIPMLLLEIIATLSF